MVNDFFDRFSITTGWLTHNNFGTYFDTLLIL